MTPLAAWRERMGLSQARAAEALGMCLRAYRYQESGARRIPRWVALACAAIEAGLEPVS